MCWQGEEREKNDEERREVGRLEERIDRLFYDFGSADEETARQEINGWSGSNQTESNGMEWNLMDLDGMR